MSATSTRRDFLKTTAATAAATSLLAAAPAVHAGGSDELKVGLIGCGGRGTGAAVNAVRAGSGIKLWAMGDLFMDQVHNSRNRLKGELGELVDVSDDRCFAGFDNHQKVIDSGVNVVLLAAPPGFRPMHLKAAVDKGLHIFAEKPVAVDAPGVRAVMAACEEAQKKNLSLVSGLCFRYDHPKRELMSRIHEGAIGDITAIHCSYNTGLLWKKDRQPGWTDMEWQCRNWLYFTWLSGDHNVEQHIHNLDKVAWAMKNQYPVKAVGLGGRQVRTAPEWGHIFDHHAVVYEFANGTKCFSYCRQQAGVANEVSDFLYGTKGVCEVMKHKITGENSWSYKGRRQERKGDMYQNEHDELFASIRSGKPINNGDYMCKSTLMAIMGRMATYTGQVITWDMAMNSQENLMPEKLEFGPLAVAPVAQPGVTKFV
jgi:predicted dehydrogenase